MSERVAVTLFGAVGVSVDGRQVPLPTGKPATVLAALALAPDAVVPVDRIIDTVWGDTPPASARALVHTYVSSLRRALAEAGPAAPAVTTSPGGYRLSIDRGDTDVGRVLGLRVDEADEGALSEALATSAPALVPGVDTEPLELLRARVARVRRALQEELWRRRLTAGGAADVVESLRDAVRTEPLDEEAVLLLARALADLGRRDDALATLDRHRFALGAELGMDPSPRAAALRQDLLVGESAPVPAPVPPDGSTDAAPLPSQPGSRRTGKTLAWTAGLALITAVVLLGLLAVQERPSGDPSDGGPPSGPALLVLGPDGLEAAEPVSLPLAPSELAVAGRTAWATSETGRAVAVVDLDDLVARAVGLAQPPTALAAAGDRATVGLGFSGTAVTVDDAGVGAPAPLVSGGTGKLVLAATEAGVGGGTIDGRLVSPEGDAFRVDLAGAGLRSLAFAGERTWLLTFDATALVAADPGAAPLSSPLRGEPVDLAADDEGAWAVTAGDDRLWQAGPAGRVVTTRALPGRPVGVALGHGLVWVAIGEPASLVAIDPADLSTVQSRDLPRPPVDVVTTPDGVLVAIG